MGLYALLYPKSIAVMGASRTPGKVGHAIVKNMIEGGYKGRVVPVNPNADEILGLKCCATIDEYPEDLDLGIVVVPQSVVEQSVIGLIKKHVKVIAVVSAGFKEIGGEGARLEQRLVDVCRKANVRLLGPNVVGIINSNEKLNASFALSMPRKGKVSVLSQSGAVCTVFLDWAKENDIGLGKLISLGNKSDLSEIDFLRFLAEDEDTEVVAGYIEDINAGYDFVEAAEAASSRKPIVFLKSGVTPSGKEAALSHTGSLSGADYAYEAAFKRAGVVRAESFEHLLDSVKAFTMQPLPVGNRVAVFTDAGGLGIIAADAIEFSEMVMARLSEETVSQLRAHLSPAASIKNPIDVLDDCLPEQYARAIEIVQKDEGVDAVLMLFAPQAVATPEDKVEAVLKVLESRKTVIAAFMGGDAVKNARCRLAGAGVPNYSSVERAVRALRAMVEYSLWRQRPPRVVVRFPVNRLRVRRVIARHVKRSKEEIGEIEAKDILEAYDFNMPERRFAATVEEAVEMAARIGYPVAMKICSPDIIHMTEFGGTKLNLSSPDVVRDTFDLMLLRVSKIRPSARLDGVYIEKMVTGGRPITLGMRRDPQFGPLLMFGLGEGMFLEVVKGQICNLAPITAEEAMRMLKGTRGHALPGDSAASTEQKLAQIVTSLQRISQLVTDFPDIVELSINPLVLGGAGSRPVVANARMTITSDRNT